MAGKKVVAAVVLGAVLAAADIAHASGACEALARQDVATSRTGRIPGLGDITATIGWDNRVQLTLSTKEFEVTRAITPNREIEITISGRGELVPLTIRLGGRDGLRVARGANVVWGTSSSASAAAFRAMTDGRAVAAFREHIGNYERRLIAGTATRVDDPHAYGFLLVGAFVGSLSGDPTAVGRARDLIAMRLQGRVRQARADFKNCVADYEKYLLQNDTNRTSCLESAGSQDSWYERAAQRMLCESEFIAGALSAEGQFITCSALLPLVK
jgi:hypothetical protein